MKHFSRIYWTLGVAVVAALTLWACRRAEGSLDDCHDATCRVMTSITAGERALGTGCVYAKHEGYFFAITNAHVVGSKQTVYCQFWKDGHESKPLPARVVRRVSTETPTCDLAVLAIEESAFGGYPPKVIPLAPPNRVMQKGETVTSAGCAKGAWATSWKGHVIGYSEDRLLFLPPPAGGRSGSAVFDAEGEQIVGLLFARAGGNSHGLACSVRAIWPHLFETSTQCPPSGCPPSGWGKGLLPPRRKPEAPGSGAPYSTLPPSTPPSGSKTEPVDLKPLERKLERIADLLIDIKGRQVTPVPIVPAPAADKAADDQAAAAVADLRAETETKLATLDGRVDQAEQDVVAIGGAVEQLDEKHQTLAEASAQYAKDHRSFLDEYRAAKAEAKEAGAGRLGAIRAAVKEAVTAKFQAWGVPAGIAGIAVLALLAFVVWDVRKKVTEGDPLLVEKVYGRIKGRLHDRLGKGEE